MKRTVLIVSLIVAGHAAAARAQSTIYVSGNVFADLQRGSGETSPIAASLDATVAGGGVRVGGFLAPRWSLEFGVDAGATTDATVSLFPTDSGVATAGLTSFVTPLPSIPPIVFVTIDERVRTRVTATSVLFGYHTPVRGRLQAGFKGGIGFLRSSNTVSTTTTYRVSDPLLLPILQLPRASTSTSSSVAFNTAAIVGAELAINLTQHAALVPEMRAFGFGGRVFLRPGAALRWSF